MFLPSTYLSASNVLQKFIVNVISNRLSLFLGYILYFMGSLTLVGVLISITPATRVRVLGRRTMYIIAFPAHLLAISCVGTMTAIWMTAEAEFSQNPGMTGALFVVGWVRFVSIVFYLAFMIAVAGAVLFSDFILKLAHAPRDQNARVEAREE